MTNEQLVTLNNIKDHLRGAEKEIFAAEECLAWDNPSCHVIYLARVKLNEVQNRVRAWEKEDSQ